MIKRFGLLALLVACDSSPGDTPDTLDASETAPDIADSTEPDIALPLRGEYIPADPQLPGDPARGYQTLSAGAYTGCGIPSELMPVADSLGMFGDDPPLPGRDEPLPYYLSRFPTGSGVEVVGPNCFTCHAAIIDGELVLGAPGIDLDFGGFASQIASFQSQIPLVADILEPESLAELERFANRLATVAPWVQTEVAGTNPADNLAGILFSHRDPNTLAWHEEPLIEPPDKLALPVDTPPLWRMGKKHAMFYSAAGRGDHSRIMMTTSTLCVDSLEEAKQIADTFDDVRAWISTLEPPPFPEATRGPIDRPLASTGEAVFLRECASCHGTYGDPSTRADDTYPNLWIRAEDVGTDSAMAIGASHAASRFVDWFNGSFYGETAWLDPKPGYVPPPLDGLWATAPFLHNGSVPTLRALLDSSSRPRYWQRLAGWNAADIGLNFREVSVGHAELTGPGRRSVYDTTLHGHGNAGHPYGDGLTDAERDAVLEYLKTL